MPPRSIVRMPPFVHTYYGRRMRHFVEMSTVNGVAAVAAAAIILLRSRRRKRKFWVNKYLASRNLSVGAVDEIRLASSELFKNFACMSPTDIEKLLHLVGPYVANLTPNTKKRYLILQNYL
ncbi:hypothetical protein PR048_028910 [Dryococelus australis]|uniref:Uncharacterized protein n=1 Tax=Dryococelus australis TaxID=614101 RepID=A0ABQ9GBX4_9NEOP|nr:hypothetical protein PR048_028910 [Dryococelus australis]